MPQRREEISLPPLISYSDNRQSSQPTLPPAPELRSYTRSPVSIGAEGFAPYSGGSSAFLGGSRIRLREAAERVHRMRARLETLEEQRRIMERDQSRPNADRPLPDFNWDQPLPAIRYHHRNSHEISDPFAYDPFQDPESASARTQSITPRPAPGIVDEFLPLHRTSRGPVVDAPLPTMSESAPWSPSIESFDGLGDRSRSFTPESDHWETMLTTIAPDTHLPSADSSFTSAAASASFSTSRSHSADSLSQSASTSRTSLTVPSEREREFELACETDEEVPAIDPLTAGIRQRNLERRLRRTDSLRRLHEHRPIYPIDGPVSPGRQQIYVRGPLRSPRREARNARGSVSPSATDAHVSTHGLPYYHDDDVFDWQRSRGSRRNQPESFVPERPWEQIPGVSATLGRMVAEGVLSNNSYGRERDADAATQETGTRSNSQQLLGGASDALAVVTDTDHIQSVRPSGQESLSAIPNPDEDLDSMRAIVERLARRDDIPEEWWASVGLTPVLAQRVRRERL